MSLAVTTEAFEAEHGSLACFYLRDDRIYGTYHTDVQTFVVVVCCIAAIVVVITGMS